MARGPTERETFEPDLRRGRKAAVGVSVGGPPGGRGHSEQAHRSWGAAHLTFEGLEWGEGSIALVVKSHVLKQETDTGLVPVSGRSPGEGNSKPFQYSCLEYSMDRGPWRLQSMGSQRGT